VHWRYNVATLLPEVPMPITTTVSSREFNQDLSKAKKATQLGPVVITDRGRPSHVLLTYRAYEEMVGDRPNILDLLAMPEADEIEFEPPRMLGNIFKPIEFE
jgi:prevent-host-death family protein